MLDAARLSLSRRHALWLPVDSIRRRLAHGAAWTILGTACLQLGNMISSIIVARLLGQRTFGEFGMVRATIVTFGAFAGSGMALAATTYVAAHRGRDAARAAELLSLVLQIAVIVSGTVTVIALAGAGPLAVHTLNNSGLVWPLRISALLIMLNVVGGVQLGAIVGFERFAAATWLNALEGTGSVILVTIGALYGGLEGALAGSVVVAAVGVVAKQAVLRSSCVRIGARLRRVNILRQWRPLVVFIMPSVLLGTALQPFDWLARVFLSRLPNGYAELALFTAAFTWAQVIVLVASQVNGPLTPVIANLRAQHEFRTLRRVIVRSQLAIVGLSLAAGAVFYFGAAHVMAAYGDSFIAGRDVLRICVLAYCVCVPALVTRAYFAATERMWLQIVHTLLGGLLLVGLSRFLAPLGARGLAMSYLAMYVAFTVLQIGTQIVLLRRDEAAHGRQAR